MRRRYMGGFEDAGETYALLLVAGQSNAEKGVLLTSVDLTAPYQVPFPEVQYYGDDGIFRSMLWTDQNSYQAPLNGVTDNYANQFYLYPRLASALGVTKLFVCSYSIGDTNLADDWDSVAPGALYTLMINRINACKALLLSTYGAVPPIPFFLWDQGEKDGRVVLDAGNYFVNFQNFVNNLRVDINEPNLRFILPQITQMSINASPNPVQLGASINNAKVSVRSADANPSSMRIINCNDCEPSTDGVHFTALGQYDKSTLQLQGAIDVGWVPGTASPAIPSGYTTFNGYGNFTRFGDILDTIFAAATQWRISLTVFKPSRYGPRTLVSKFATTGGQRSFHWLMSGSNILFNYYMVVGTGTRVRGITWTGAALHDGLEHIYEIRYDGTVNTNDGLDRADLYRDGVLVSTGKSLTTTIGVIGTIFNGTAQLAVGAIVATGGAADSTNFFLSGYAKDFKVWDSAVALQIDCPNLLTGTDISGNGNNGTFV